jgi:hypothetical protein
LIEFVSFDFLLVVGGFIYLQKLRSLVSAVIKGGVGDAKVAENSGLLGFYSKFSISQDIEVGVIGSHWLFWLCSLPVYLLICQTKQKSLSRSISFLDIIGVHCKTAYNGAVC